MKIYRIFVEKKDNLQAKKVAEDLRNLLKIGVKDVRKLIRYDVEGLTSEEFASAVPCVFSEPPVDTVYNESVEFGKEYKVFAVAYLTGQYDQRADSAAQCVQLLTQKERPLIKCATVYAISGVDEKQLTVQADVMADGLGRIRDTVAEYGGYYCYVAVPNQYVYGAEAYPSYMDSRFQKQHLNVELLSAALAERGVDFLDVGAEVEALGRPEGFMSKVDHHYTMEGAF